MATHSHVKVYIHMIWGTHKRERILTREIRLKLFDHFVERFDELKITVEKLNIQAEHLHILLQLPVDKTLPEIPKKFEGRIIALDKSSEFLSG